MRVSGKGGEPAEVKGEWGGVGWGPESSLLF